jgi:tetratricopeptide (TPR) repeat protein
MVSASAVAAAMLVCTGLSFPTRAAAPIGTDQHVETGTADSASALAAELVQTDRLDEAEVLLDEVLAAEPGHVQARFLKGMIAVAKGDNGKAVRLFRSILIDHPDATRVRLELARAFYLAKDYGNAMRQFQFALAEELPPQVVARINGYIGAIREAKGVSYNLGISFAPDTNLNTGSSAREVSLFGLPFDLSADARQRSGVGLQIEIGGEWAPRVGEGKRIRLGLNALRREYVGPTFDDMVVAGHLGPRVVTGRWDLSVLGTAYARWYGGRSYSRASGLRAEATHYPSPRLTLSGALSAQRIDYDRGPLQNGLLVALNAGAFYALSASSGLTAKSGASRQTARAAPFANWSGFVAAGYFKDLPQGFSAYVEPSFSFAEYDARFLSFGDRRSDRTMSLLVTLLNRRVVLGRFTPRLAYVYTRQSSSIPLYAFDRHRFEIGLTTAF